MNIFLLDKSPIAAAQFQHDRHVVKMILESCQMLSTAIHTSSSYRRLYDSSRERSPDFGDIYKPTHANHPCTLWVDQHESNFVWLTIHLDSLLREYAMRFPGKQHACERLKFMFAIMSAQLAGQPHESKPHRANCGFYVAGDIPGSLAVHPAILAYAMTQHTPFAVCMPDEYKMADPIDSYRNYYARTKIFQDHVKWTRRLLPHWLESNDYGREVALRVADLREANRIDAYPPLAKATIRKPAKPYVPVAHAEPARVKMPPRFGVSK